MDRIIRREPADWRHSVAFTGHRPQKLPFGFDETDPRCVDFKRRLCNSIEMMILEGYTHFISGGALGMDMYAAEAVLTLREQYPEITLEIAIPHNGQTAKWPRLQSGRNPCATGRSASARKRMSSHGLRTSIPSAAYSIGTTTWRRIAACCWHVLTVSPAVRRRPSRRHVGWGG